MSAITAKASRKMKKYAVLTREPRCFLGSFDFSWEQRKLGDVATFINGRAYSQPELLSSGKCKVLRVGNFYTNDSWYYSDLELGEKYYADYGDLLYTWSATFGPHIWLGDRVIYHYHIWKIDLSNQLEKQFAVQLLEQDKANILSSKNGSTMVHITKEGMEQKDVIIPPSTKEQQEIGAFFQQLDNLITLHQRKCALLFSSFQALISMMFTTSTFSWEQRKLGDIADIVGGGTPSTGNPNYWDGDIDWYAPAEIASQIYANSSQKKITDLGYENSSAKMLPPGTVLFTSRAGIGKTAILTRKGCTNQGFQSIVPHRGELDSYFIFSRTEELKRYGELVGAGSTFVEVSGKQMAVMELMMPPTMREQQTIGGFFQQLDHLITLHQRKCISFTGRAGRLISTVNKKRITSSWEQRKFSDITFPAGEKNRDNLPLESYSITNEHGFVPQDEKFENGGTMREADKRMYYIVSPNSFAYNPARINVGSIGYQNIGKNVIVSSLYEVFKTSEDVDDRLLWHWFKSPDFQKLIMQLQEGGVRLYFYYDKLCMGEVSLPSLEEQRKIGKLFDTLDNLITLHQRELEKLQNIKKSMLEKMFV